MNLFLSLSFIFGQIYSENGDTIVTHSVEKTDMRKSKTYEIGKKNING
jgi:hypothetical protein